MDNKKVDNKEIDNKLGRLSNNKVLDKDKDSRY